ncbi:MAG: hypothetical protein DHS20C21_19900 [Gemmatimonadota bacterium]|nr:MAG: hypothetical protein DHS20C21_19900 [Gemmatimonadota bacterium]
MNPGCPRFAAGETRETTVKQNVTPPVEHSTGRAPLPSPTWQVTWEETEDAREFVVQLRTSDDVLTRRVRLQTHAPAGA